MFARILVGLDGSAGADAALAAAIALARRFDSRIFLAAVSDSRVLEAPYLGGTMVMWAEGAPASPGVAELGRIMEARAATLLGDAATRVAAAGVRCESLRATGLVHEELVRLAAQADLIVVGRRGEMHARPGTLGTVTAHLIHRGPVPVLVAGELPSAFTRPVVAFDGGDTSLSALALATRWATAAGIAIDVVVVSDDAAAGGALLARAQESLAHGGVPHTTHLLQGDVVRAIAAHMERGGADLLLAGAHGGRKGTGWSIGSHAQRLVRATRVPAIIAR
jgi:nucleotide-binding universal stress UspA family protein